MSYVVISSSLSRIAQNHPSFIQKLELGIRASFVRMEYECCFVETLFEGGIISSSLGTEYVVVVFFFTSLHFNQFIINTVIIRGFGVLGEDRDVQRGYN